MSERKTVVCVRRSWLSRGGICLWLAAVVALSMAPLEVKNRLRTTGELHDVGHLLVFAVTQSLIASTCTGIRGAIIAVALVWSLGTALEVAQAIVYGNDFEWWDVGVNAAGVIAGAYVGAWRATSALANRCSHEEQY